jgi:site-specific DNA-methyltransferase (adenine-specific)
MNTSTLALDLGGDANAHLGEDSRRQLSQWFTPTWAAALLVEDYFGDLPDRSSLCEVSCGRGNFLGAIPDRFDAFGVEIDPDLARQAEAATGRRVLVGDFREVPLPDRIDAFLGNPPFVADVFDGFLDRIHGLLPDGGRAGFILPSYIFQTSSRVLRYNERFTLRQDMLPGKDLFPGLSYPLSFVLFTKDQRPTLINMRLYRDAGAIKQLPEGVRRCLVHDVPAAGMSGGIWRLAVDAALRAIGRPATVREVTEFLRLRNRRPSDAPTWEAKVRQVLRRFYPRVAPATYSCHG